MKLPVFEEFILTNFAPDNIRERLQRFNAGKVPLFLLLAEEDLSQIELKLSALKKEMDKLSINTKIPYPLYIINSVLAHHPDFIVMKSAKELPLHFTKPSKRLNNKETAKLSKSDLLSDKIINSDPVAVLEQLKPRQSKMREIKKLSKETLFLEALARELFKKRSTK